MIMKKYSVKNYQTLRSPTGAVRIDDEEKALAHGGARRPNSIAWRAGQAFIGMQFFGVPGLALFFL